MTATSTPAANVPTPDLGEISTLARELREYYARQPHRPGYHFIVPEGAHWCVDPNGALFWNGRYHLCYIYIHRGKPCWGHASSIDLVHWRHHEPAIVAGGPDDGIFSGGAFIDKNGVPTLVYWALGKPDGIAFATSTDPHLDRWTKSPGNPVIASTQFGIREETRPDGSKIVYGSADPSAVWIKDGRYYMLTGNLLVLNEYGNKQNLAEHKGDRTYLLVSDDLVTWTYLHKFYESDRKWTHESEDDMCPDFFPLPSSPNGGEPGDTHMLLFISHNKGCQYYLGKYADDRFTPATHGRMTWNDNQFFAPESLVDDRGRRIMWSWIFDRRTDPTRYASAHSGELSLPRLLWLGADGTLKMRPVEELKTLRYNPKLLAPMTLSAGEECPISSLGGNSIELQIQVTPPDSGVFGIKVCCAADQAEFTTVTCDTAKGTLNVDTTFSSLGEGTKVVESAPFVLAKNEPLDLRIFIDKSVIEVFANDRQAIVRRIYPTRADSVGVRLFCADGTSSVSVLNQWEMMPSNPY